MLPEWLLASPPPQCPIAADSQFLLGSDPLQRLAIGQYPT
jgi:hypothetical protein